jgi:hypothetical protein
MAMKAILEFNLPEDIDYYNMHKQTTNMYLALSEIISLFRNKLKHEKLTDAEYDVIEKLSKEIHEIISGNEVLL